MHESKQFAMEWITLVIALVYDIDYNKTEYSVSKGEGKKIELDNTRLIWTSLWLSELV